MNEYMIAPMVVLVTLILTTGGVILLRPITRHLAAYLQVLTEQKRLPPPTGGASDLQLPLENIERRLALLEERQQFTEDLLEKRAAQLLPKAERTYGD